MERREKQVRLIQELSSAERRWQPDPVEWLKEQENMADDKTKVGGHDRARINVDEDHEVRGWSKSLGITEDELRKAVAAVGDQADKVREHLGKK